MSRRARQSREFWFEHARAAGRAEHSIDVYAREHNLSVKALYRWRGELRRAQALEKSAGVHTSSSDFVRVEMPDVRVPMTPTLRVTYPNGCSVALEGEVDAQTLGIVLLTVGSA
jgi:transposase-like protein